VERLLPRRNVLGRDDRALDDEDVESPLQGPGRQLLDSLRGEAGGGDDAGFLHLGHAPADQLRLDRLEVDLLHPPGGFVRLQLGDLLEIRLGIVVTDPQPFEIEHPEAAEAADLDGGVRAERSVHRRAQHREGEAAGVELPADVDVVGVPGPPAGDDGYVIESVGLTARLAYADVDFHAGSSAERRAPTRLPVLPPPPDRYPSRP